MLHNPLVSIIIPIFNAENFITKTLESVVNQTYSNIEVILVNDGSFDKSETLITSFCKKFDWIKILNQQNQGVSVARNNGLINSNGKYVLFLDSDDILDSLFVETSVNLIETNVVIGIGNICYTLIQDSINYNQKYQSASNQEELVLFESNIQTCPSGYLFSKAFLILNKIRFQETLGNTADRYFLHQCFQHGNFIINYKSYYLYRITEGSMSKKISQKLIEDYRKYLKLLKTNDLIPLKHFKSYRARYLYTISAYYYHLNNIQSSIVYAFKSFITAPLTFLKLLNAKP